MKITSIFAFSALLVSPLIGQSSNSRDIMARVSSEIPARSNTAEIIVEKRLSGLEKYPSFVPLEKSVRENWREDLLEFENVADTAAKKSLYFKAAETLDVENYIEFLRLAGKATASQKIEKQQFKWALFPSQKHLRDMWTQNPPSQSLKELAREAEAILSDDLSTARFLKDVQGGVVAQAYLEDKHKHSNEAIQETQSQQIASNAKSNQSDESQIPRDSSEELVDKSRSWKASIYIIGIFLIAAAAWLALKKKSV